VWDANGRVYFKVGGWGVCFLGGSGGGSGGGGGGVLGRWGCVGGGGGVGGGAGAQECFEQGAVVQKQGGCACPNRCWRCVCTEGLGWRKMHYHPQAPDVHFRSAVCQIPTPCHNSSQLQYACSSHCSVGETRLSCQPCLINGASLCWISRYLLTGFSSAFAKPNLTLHVSTLGQRIKPSMGQSQVLYHAVKAVSCRVVPCYASSGLHALPP